MERFKERNLMPYKGCRIVKLWSLEGRTIKKESIFYRAYMNGGKGYLCATSRCLPELKRKIDELMRSGSPTAVITAYISQPKIRFGGGNIKWLDESSYIKM